MVILFTRCCKVNVENSIYWTLRPVATHCKGKWIKMISIAASHLFSSTAWLDLPQGVQQSSIRNGNWFLFQFGRSRGYLGNLWLLVANFLWIHLPSNRWSIHAEMFHFGKGFLFLGVSLARHLRALLPRGRRLSFITSAPLSSTAKPTRHTSSLTTPFATVGCKGEMEKERNNVGDKEERREREKEWDLQE